jgi:fructose-1,6-bisphosphatase II
MTEQATRTAVLSDLALDLARVTEDGATAAVAHAGMGDKNRLDAAAVDAMRDRLKTMAIEGTVVIGEGEKDEAPMLYNGERVGRGGLAVDIAVDPIDGTTLLSKGLAGAISVIALSGRGTMHVPIEVFYMDKIATGAGAAGAIDIDAPVADNLAAVAKALDKTVGEVTVVILDRPRHEQLIKDVRAAGGRVKLISDGDVAAGIQTALPDSEIDVLMGIGGTPEGVIAAAALRCTGGEIQCKAWPRDDAERQKCQDAGLDLARVYTTEDLCGGDQVLFSATGASNGEMLKGVRKSPDETWTQTVVMDAASGTIRWIEATRRTGR